MERERRIPDPRRLAAMGETFASGYFEEPEAPPLNRMARGMRRHLEGAVLPPWTGGSLYPSGNWDIWENGASVSFHYSHSMVFRHATLESLRRRHGTPEAAADIDALEQHLTGYFTVGSSIPPDLRLGGAGYTHSILNYGRVLREGLCGYAARVRVGLEIARRERNSRRQRFYEAMDDVLAGIRVFHAHTVEALTRTPFTDPSSERQRRELLGSLGRVPFQPARTFAEAMAAVNFLYYLDGCDSLGRFDQDVGPYYERDASAGLVTPEIAERLVRSLWENVDAASGWNVALGGSRQDGSQAYGPFTLICLRAAKSIRRPNLALRVRRDMPPEVFDAALDVVASGCGLPAFYSEEGYLRALREAGLGIRDEDLADFAFGGCTETMVHGKSNVGSLDAGINLLQVLSETLEDRLASAADFQALLDAYRADLRDAIARLVEGVNRDQEGKARFQPQPMRTLLVDDCLEAGREYNDGGARYNWSVVNVGGLANVVDALVAVRILVFEERSLAPPELLAALRTDFQGDAPLLARIEACPRFGNDDPAVDPLASDLSAFVFREFGRHVPWRGGRFLPGCLMFVTYAGAGEKVPATPDGRRAGSPIADSAGPVQGRDRKGPTAMLASVARLAHRLAPGTLVVNARFSRSMFGSPERKARLIGLIRTYFEMGGMQIQVNVVDQAVLRDALEHPERHGDLIVRIGGYSEYFNRLSPALQRSLLERTEHE